MMTHSMSSIARQSKRDRLLLELHLHRFPGQGGGKKMKMSKESGNKPLIGFKDAAKDFLDSVTSRLTVAQVVDGVRSGTELNFDFHVYLLMAAFICAFGLVAEDPVNIGASMMIEGIMVSWISQVNFE